MFNPLCSSRNQKTLKRTFVIKVATTDDFRNKWKPSRGYHKIDQWWTKMNGTQRLRRAVVSPWRMHCMYSSMVKGTSWAEATSNSEKIQPVALVIQGGGTPIYPVLLSSSSVKTKVKSQAKNLQLVKGQTRFVIVYHDRYFYVNIKLQKYTGIRSKVKCNF